MLTIKPVPGILVVEPLIETVVNGIYLPNPVESQNCGKVLLVGEGVPGINAKDGVYFKKYAGNRYKWDKKDIIFLKYEDILGVF